MNPTQEFWKLKDFAVQHKTAKKYNMQLEHIVYRKLLSDT